MYYDDCCVIKLFVVTFALLQIFFVFYPFLWLAYVFLLSFPKTCVLASIRIQTNSKILFNNFNFLNLHIFHGFKTFLMFFCCQLVFFCRSSIQQPFEFLTFSYQFTCLVFSLPSCMPGLSNLLFATF